MYFPSEEGKHPYTLYIHWQDKTPQLKAAIGFSNGVKIINFQLPNTSAPTTVKDFKYASKMSAEIKGISNKETISRLFGVPTANTYDKRWLNVEGVTVDGKEVFIQYDKGTLEIGKQTENYSELFLSGSRLSGRWLLRKIPNIFDKAFIDRERESEIAVLWKPSLQSSSPKGEYTQVTCDCPLKVLSKSSTPKNTPTYKTSSRLQAGITFNSLGEFEGTACAEGTWIDMFGVKYVYTADFVKKLASQMSQSANQGKLIVDKDHSNDDNGSIYAVSLFQDPINYVKVKGRYNGDLSSAMGLSLELRLRSVWNEEFQAWVPFEAITDRVSLVGDPACKICWINQVNK